jgi:AsmA protein
LNLKKIISKFLKITGIAFGILLLLLFLLPYLFPTAISNEIKKLANANLKGDLNFSKARLSIFNHFPALTVTLYDFTLKGSAPFEKDTLLACNELAFGLDATSLFKSKTDINKIFLTNAFINIQVDSLGHANYNVYVAKKDQKATNDSSNTSLRIEQIIIENSKLVYNDQSLPMLINAKGFNYLGKGDLSKEVFDLQTHMQVDSLDFSYDNTTYVKSKKVAADLITQINTNSLELGFTKNNLKINQLPVQFIGNFKFLKDGYDMDFKIDSKETGLYNVVTALPPAYLKWTDHVQLDGRANIFAELAGKYISATGQMPDFKLKAAIQNGSVDYEKATTPATNLFFDFNLKLPGLDTDSLRIDVDTLGFNIDKAYFNTVVHTTGLNNPTIFAKINTEDMDLAKFDEAFGLKTFHVKGKFSLHLLAQGKYATRVVNSGKNKKDTIISSIPTFNVTSILENGFFKLDSLSEGIKNISFKLTAFCPDNNYKHAQLAFENINAEALSNYIKGFIKLNYRNDINIDANLHTKFNLAEIKQFYPLDSLDLKGDAAINLVSKGRYNMAKKLFPITNAYIKMNNGSITTKYSPQRIDKIMVDATITNTGGTLGTTSVFLKPVSFSFAGQPFMVSAGLKNFSDITYSIQSKGQIDLGKIYKVFAYNGLDAKGYLETNVSLKGSQQDLVAGRYDRLFNTGQIKVRDMVLVSQYFPKPFLISTGVFSFKQDKMWFDQFHATYGKSDFTLDGYLSNVINYALQNQPLMGNFNLTGNKLVVDEFMALSGGGNANTPQQAQKSAASGVVMVPENLDMVFTANIKKVFYNGLKLDSAQGQMQLQKGLLILKEMGFKIIDAAVTMDATYQSQSATKAVFDYHIKASDFDIHKAYTQIKLFHDMATSAASAQGIVTLDYQLKGRLNEQMMPVYPSLSGGGVLSIKQVKMKGFKLMDALSNGTGKEDIKDPDLSKIDIKTKIANNLITIERVKLRVAGFRPRFQGQVSLDGRLDLTGRLGLPPFGIFGIPFTVTGTQANPIMHFRRNRESDKLEETEDPDDDDRPKGDSSQLKISTKPKQ